MCGIVGYTGARQASGVLLQGLERLEYRGYDSAGLVVQTPAKLLCVRAVGAVGKLVDRVTASPARGTCGIGHTRWATHGVPSEENAHPHLDCTGSLAIVHNGILENYRELKEALEVQGHIFRSQTDSEVFAHLIERERATRPLMAAVQSALRQARGTWGLVVVADDLPQTIVVARMGSPLAVGVGKGEMYVASDSAAIVPYTRDILFLDDGEVASVTAEGITLTTIDDRRVHRESSRVDMDIEKARKGGWPHFMLKEVLEQPEAVENSLRGRIDMLGGRAVLGGLRDVLPRLAELERIIIVGCGSAYYAGLLGEYLFEEIAGIPTEVELGSEFRYRKPIITPRTAVLAISQSGETADTLEAVREGKRKQALTLGLVNVVGSSIARETDAGVYNHAGPEIGVASTKAFVSQLVVLALMAVSIGQARGTVDGTMIGALLAELYEMPERIREVLGRRDEIRALARAHTSMQGCFFLGRKFQAPIAYEGALKLKEVSYIHAEGYTSGEMKHGPLALVGEAFPSVVLCPEDSVFEKTRGNIEELRARKGPVIAVTTNRRAVEHLTGSIIEVPKTLECLQPILTVIPLQLLAYEMAVARGLNPDRPRNLAKSVTVE